MTWVFVEPKSVLLFRDGRSFEGSSLGRSLDHPMPQVLLGALRSRIGRALDFDWDFARAPGAVRAVLGTPENPGSLRLQGPYLARRSDQGVVEPLFARPADVVAFPTGRGRRDKDHQDYPLRPDLNSSVEVGPANGLDYPLFPLRHRQVKDSKPLPADQVPRFWDAGRFGRWLIKEGTEPISGARQQDPVRDLRDHVTISEVQLTARDEMSYRTDCLEMPVPFEGSWTSDRYGYLVGIDGTNGLDASQLEGHWRIGGKGGIGHTWVVKAPDVLGQWREDVLGSLETKFRWILTTPGRFRGGWLPGWIARNGWATFPGTSFRARLIAAAVDRPLAYSGWDLRAGSPTGDGAGAPRPTRLFTRPGSVYFFEAEKPEVAHGIVRDCWFRSLTDVGDGGPSDRIDAVVGLATGVFGRWSPYELPTNLV